MRLFDTHCHFDFEPFSQNFDSQLLRANQHGVERFVIPTIGPSNWSSVALLAKQHPSLFFALGFHPYFIDAQSVEHFSLLESLLANQPAQCVAVGECGLDGAIPLQASIQEQVFIRQLELAASFHLPVILHGRKTHNRMLQLIKNSRFKGGGVLHGFSGSYQQAMQFVELGFYIGVGGVITYPRAQKTRRAVKQLSLEHIVLETDAPDMPLYGHQGEINHPKMLTKILACLADLKEMPFQTVMDSVWSNSHLAFNMDDGA
ncbi:TatD family hydrolase [Vibrio ostreicida]|uniref:TatD family hydrolase n=1 Tax=Vibrio ostreicida TaxID=526588 RepID=UPI003B59838B